MGKVTKMKKGRGQRNAEEEKDNPIAAPQVDFVEKEEPKQKEEEEDYPEKEILKQKDEEGGDDRSLFLSHVKKRKNPRNPSTGKKSPEEKIRKKEEEEEKKVVVKVSKDGVAQDKDRKEKKVYNLPGQKHDQPDERDPLRIFYETLYQQMPDSELAAIWMMEWGLLPQDEAEEVYEKKLMKNQQQKIGSPDDAILPTKSSKISIKKGKKTALKKVSKTKKRKLYEDTEDDLILSKIKKQKISSS